MMNLCCKQILCENPCANNSYYCKVINEGALIVSFYVDFNIGVTSHRINSSLIYPNHYAIIKYPIYATNIRIRILNQSVESSPVICIKNTLEALRICIVVQGSKYTPLCEQLPLNSIGNIINPCICMNLFTNCK
ncbi:hypothetical protein G8S21_10065 [Clostridium botulinum C]|uniref:hypothetical protein n=1 Tax=Clostridium botulinum TaxID=1491 RepID=UPI001E2AF7A2|nr:hypothetical protein [Clostridium botulinum]MCD3246282.1 hypothetical protein [Clostridium botulinum C]MCD3262646.1 hypothetical protein [Clostridium botulinum C]